MPGLNRKGPEGKGSMTGRGLGKCNPQNENDQIEPNTENDEARGSARGLGRGRGRGFRRGFGNQGGGGRGMGRANA